MSAKETLEDLSFQEISAIILPALVANEALLESDVELIRNLAEKALDADPSLSLEDALINAAGERLSAREHLASSRMAVVDRSGLVHGVVDEGKHLGAMKEIASDEREHRDHSNSN